MKKRPLCMLCLVFIVIQGVLLVFASGDNMVKIPASSIFYEHEQLGNILVHGQVYKKENTSKNQILYLKNNSYDNSKIIVYDDSFAKVSIGQNVCIRGDAKRFLKARNPGNFDMSLYYAKQEIYGFLWSSEIISIEGTENVFLENIHQIREKWKQILIKHMGEQGGTLSAMLLGDKAYIEEDTREFYQKSGISHVLAISGLHITFLGWGVYCLFRKLGVSYLFSGIIAIGILTSYTLLIGFSVSVLRAFIMLFFRVVADIVGRVYDPFTALAFAAAITIAYQPLYLIDGGFYMSYGAIIAVLGILPMIKKMFVIKNKWLEVFFASITINIVLFPILLLFYYEVSTYSVILNLIVVPLMPWVLSVGILGSLLYIIWNPIGIILLKLCEGILCLFEQMSELGCGLPFSRMVLGKPELWKVVGYYILLVIFCVFLKCEKKRKIFTVLKVITGLCVVSAWLMFYKFPDGRLHISVLDVGQGDCIYLKGPSGTTYLVDGGSSSVENVAKYRIESFLLSQGVGELDYVFISHGDSDHYNGIAEMMERQNVGIRINTLIFPVNYRTDVELMNMYDLADKKGIRCVVMDAGETIEEEKLKIKCIQPDVKHDFTGKNANSMVLSISYGDFNMLLTGDVEDEGEAMLEKNVEGRTYDILKVAHHGSKKSTSSTFLATIKPKLAIISVGKNNLYGHPHEELLDRLKEWEVPWYETSEKGAITIETDGDMIDIFTSSI